VTVTFSVRPSRRPLRDLLRANGKDGPGIRIAALSSKRIRRRAITDALRAQYEAYPYPERDPADEARRLIAGSPGHPLEIDHYVFGGRRDWTRPFHAMVAGGGTGDGAIMLAQLLADRNCPAELVHLDISAASQAIARARAAARGLANLRFVQGSLLDLDRLGLGPFDYIDCCGVLHHLDDPAAGLAALVAALAPDGGIGAMVYAPYGRAGVYEMQAALRMLTGAAPPAERLAVAHRAVGQLPPTNGLARNPFVTDHRTQGDAGLYDLLLNPIDRPFTVREVAALVAGAGLRLTGLIEPMRYRPEWFVADQDIRARLAGMDALDRASFAELWAGNMRRHVFYAVREGNRRVVPPAPDNPDAVPVPHDLDTAQLARAVAAGQAMKVDFDGLAVRVALPPLAGAIAAEIDGARSIAEIRARLRPAPDPAAFRAALDALYDALNGLNRLFLRIPGD
jgi:SAM-dependent methyltransferase